MIKLLRRIIPAFDNLLESFLGSFADTVMVVIDIAIIYLFVRIAIPVIKRIVSGSVKRKAEKTGNASRYATIGKLLDHAVTALVWYVGIVAVLSELELTTTAMSMLATAGIGGVAVGIGAQSFIQDVINGGFILIEQQIAVGDYVRMAGVDGTVEDINMRTTRLRAFSGELHIIPNSSVTVLTNYSRGTNRALIDVPMPYDEDPRRVCDILSKAMEEYYEEHGELLDKAPEVIGITEYAGSAIMIRIVAFCKNLGHWETERGMRAAVLDAFSKNGISIPYDTVVVMAHDGGKTDE